MPCTCPATGTEAGRSTDFNILVHLDWIGDSRLLKARCAGFREEAVMRICGKPRLSGPHPGAPGVPG